MKYEQKILENSRETRLFKKTRILTQGHLSRVPFRCLRIWELLHSLEANAHGDWYQGQVSGLASNWRTAKRKVGRK